MSVYIFKEPLQPAHVQVPDGVRNLHIQIPTDQAIVPVVTSYVDPDATGTNTGEDWTNAFTSLNAADAANFNATSQDLVANNETVLCLCRSSAGTADTSPVTVENFITDSTHLIRIQAELGHEALKTGWDTSRYRLETANTYRSIRLRDQNYVELVNLQIGNTSIGRAIESALGNLYISGCRVVTQDSVVIQTLSGYYRIENSILIGNRDIGYPDGINIGSSNTGADIYNCVVYDCYDGIADGSSGVVNIHNCAIFNNASDDIEMGGSTNATHNATDDGDGTNPIAPSGGDWNNEFADPTNGDFTLLPGGNLYRAGTPIVGLDTDIDGDDWNVIPSVGVDEP